MMEQKRYKAKNADFGRDISRIMPLIIREATRRQKSIITKGLLTVSQFVILDLLVEKGSCKMSGLAGALGFTMSAVTPIVDKMIRLKLVERERSSEDRRVVNVIMLDKGRQTVERLNEERRNITNSIFSPLTEEERNQYLRLLTKVYDNLRKRK